MEASLMKVIEFNADHRNQAVGGALDHAAFAGSEILLGDETPKSGTGAPGPAAQPPVQKPRSAGAWFLLAFLRFYIVCLSPVFGGACKFYPSCSNYAVEAVTKHGARRGFVLAAKRLMRCRPFTTGGFDPVPDDVPHSKRTRRASRKLQVVSGTELKIRATERRML
jgi:uncharacterized protein